MQKPKDLPFNDCVKQADDLIREGATVYQKFTCIGCGSRLTIETPNTFHRIGYCDRCPALTNITACGFMLVVGPKKGELQ